MDIISRDIYLTAGSASGPQLGPSHPAEGDITALQQVQAVSLKTSYLVAFKICLFQSFDIQLILYCPTMVFLRQVHLPEMIFLFQESNTACGIWKLACTKAPLCLLTVRKVTANKINYVGEGRGFQKINLVSVHLHWQASQTTVRVDRRT